QLVFRTVLMNIKTKKMKKLFSALIIMFFVSAVSAQNRTKLLEGYIQIKNALVKSDNKEAQVAISTFYESLKADKELAANGPLVKATEKLNKAGTNLEKQRAAFNEVSTVSWKLLKDASE